MSQVTGMTRRPSASISPAVRSRPCVLMSTSTKLAPTSANPSAMARPMPLAAPETSATRPVRSNNGCNITLNPPLKARQNLWSLLGHQHHLLRAGAERAAGPLVHAGLDRKDHAGLDGRVVVGHQPWQLVHR